MERSSDESESGECELVHGSLWVPLRRWVGREVRSGSYDRGLRCLRDDVAVGIHLHEGCVEGSGHLTALLGVHVLRSGAVLVVVVAVRAGADAHGGERTSSRAGLRGCLLAFAENF